MELLAACEDLAANITAFDAADDSSHISESDISMWQALFGLSLDEASDAIRDWRADFTRPTISQTSWLTVKDAKVAEGFNKESYEYGIFTAQRASQRVFTPSDGTVVKDENVQYLLKLECNGGRVLEAAELIRCLPKKPNMLSGIDDNGNTSLFCLLTIDQRTDFLRALPKTSQPNLVRISLARKDLSPTSLYPTLGIDTTLPQFRPDSVMERNPSDLSLPPSPNRPAQNEYPVWYFFYGTLTDPKVLSRLIGVGLHDSIKYKQACVHRGKLSSWGGKYLGLVDGHEGSRVPGWAYQVKNQNDEESLRVYETGKYEVVRCTIEFLDEGGSIVHGLTFRLV